jgi:hypothetical protein
MIIGNISAQVPTLVSHSHSVGYGSVTVCIEYLANDVNDIGIQIQIGKSPGDIYYDYNFTAPADSTSWCKLLSNLTVCERFRLLLNLSNTNGVGQVYDPLFEFRTGCTLGINETNVSQIELKNYAGSNISISRSEGKIQNATINVFDVSGRKISSSNWTDETQKISTTSLERGLYFVQISTGTHTLYTDRFTVN